MGIIRTVSEADVEGAAAGFYAADTKAQGFVSAHTKVMALNPEAFAAWEALIVPLVGEDQLLRIASDYRSAGLSEAEVAMMAFAERVSVDSWAMTDADAQRLRECGFTDREIVDIAVAAAARNFYSRAIQALAVEVEVPAAMGAALSEALEGKRDHGK